MKSYIKEVVFINNTVAPYRIPLFNRIAKLLDEQNVSMKAVFLCEKESVRDWSIDYETINFQYEILPALYQKRDIKTTTSDVIINRGFMKYIFSDTVIIFGYSYPTFLIIMFFRKLLFRKTILFSESTLSDKARSSELKHTIKSILIRKLFSSYITPGKEAQKFIESYGVLPSKITIAENSIEPFSEYKTMPSKSSVINLLYVGRLAKEKNLKFLLNSIPTDSQFMYKVTLVGSGPEESELRNIKTNFPVEFKGFLEGEALANEFLDADLFVLPSNSEPWGLVINEAVNAGLAVLVSDRVGCRHELVQGNGRIFELNNREDFEKHLNFISHNLGILQDESLNISKKITLDNQANKIFRVVYNA